jgi:hypothetical protein
VAVPQSQGGVTRACRKVAVERGSWSSASQGVFRRQDTKWTKPADLPVESLKMLPSPSALKKYRTCTPPVVVGNAGAMRHGQTSQEYRERTILIVIWASMSARSVARITSRKIRSGARGRAQDRRHIVYTLAAVSRSRLDCDATNSACGRSATQSLRRLQRMRHGSLFRTRPHLTAGHMEIVQGT